MSKIAADSGHAQNFFLFVLEKSYLSLIFFSPFALNLQT